MASLANQTISSSYDGLIKTATDQPVPVSGVQLLEDGTGNSLAISIGRANQGVTITGALAATSLSGVLVDGVTATTQSPGDNSTKVATTAYVDAQVTASDLDFAGDSGTGAVDLDSQTFTIAGTANEIETSASGQTITVGLPSSVTVGTLNATTLGGTLSTAAQPNITSVGTLSSLAVSGNLTVDTNTLYVDATNNRVGIGTSSPSSILHTLGTGGAVSSPLIETSDTTAYVGVKIKQNGDFWIAKDTSTGGAFNTSAYANVLWGSGAYPMVFSTNSTERMRIDSSGNVGIGESNPTNPLTLYKNASQGSPSSHTPANATLKIEDSVNTMYLDGNSIVATGTAALTIGNTGAEDIVLYTDATERMRIDSSGNVGIGISNPDSYDTNADNLVIGSTGANDRNGITIVGGDTDGRGAVYFADTTQNSAGYITYLHSNNSMLFGTSDITRMRIDSSGNILFAATGVPNGTTIFGSAFRVDSNGRRTLRLATSSTANQDLIELYNPNGFAGSIGSSGDELYINFGGSTGGAVTSRTLDDYEEGTWTMGVAFGGLGVGVSALNNQGKYTKIGNMVTVTGYLRLSSKGTSSGDAWITGLPFAIPDSPLNYSTPSLRLNYISFANQFQAYGILNSTSIALDEITEAGTVTNLTNANFNNNSEIVISFTYQTS